MKYVWIVQESAHYRLQAVYGSQEGADKAVDDHMALFGNRWRESRDGEVNRWCGNGPGLIGWERHEVQP